MLKKLNDVEIVEPPFQELKKKNSCLARVCSASCVIIILFAITVILFFKYALEPDKKEIKEIPELFKKEINFSYEENIEKINYATGESKQKEMQILTFLPKLAISPVVLYMEPEKYQEENEKSYWRMLKKYIKEPAVDRIDKISIEWKNIKSSPDQIQNEYIEKFKNRNYEIVISDRSGNTRQFSFKKEKKEGVFLLKDDPETEYSDYLIIKFQVPFTN